MLMQHYILQEILWHTHDKSWLNPEPDRSVHLLPA